jgi:hypothetical protein
MGVQDKVKLVVDLHDLDSIRRGMIPIPEREMFNCADGLIYVSMPVQDITNKLQGVNIPNIVLYSYCNDGIVDYDLSKMGERHGLVYEGGANSPGDKVLNEAFAYRSLYDIMKKLVEMGNETTMFCGNFDAFQSYQNIGVVLKPPTDYDELMQAMVNYKYGILVFNNEGNTEAQVKYTLTNKMFEYAKTGLPSIACWCEESMNYIKKWDIGFTFSHLNDIGNCSQLEDRYLQVMENISNFNKKVSMETFIWKSENLYAKLLGLESKGIPDNIKEISEFDYNKEEIANILSW